MDKINGIEVFQKRFGSYLSWLSSMIELWERNPELLRRIDVTSKLMREKYVNGVNLADLEDDSKIVQELFEIVADAYPDEVEQVESKLSHFLSGIKEMQGSEVTLEEKPVRVVKKTRKVKKAKLNVREVKKLPVDSVAYRIGQWLRRFIYGDDNL
jgi:hypothetical protein